MGLGSTRRDAFAVAANTADSVISLLRRTMSGRLTRLAAKAPQTKPICTPFVNQERSHGERCHSRFNSGVIAVDENQVVSDRIIAIDNTAKTRQRNASAPPCNEPAALVDDGVGIVASGSPERNCVDSRRAREAYVTSLIAHGRLNLTDRLVRPDLPD